MSALSDLRKSLQESTDASLRGLDLEWTQLDKSIGRLRKWLGDRGAEKPPTDLIRAALDRFVRQQELKGLRQTMLVCFGAIERIESRPFGLIEDDDRFPRLLDSVDIYRSNARALRPCYRGLLNAYFGFDVERGPKAGQRNWERLRDYLRDRAKHLNAPGLSPTWVDVLGANLQLLGPEPGRHFGADLLRGHRETFDTVRAALAVSENSWLIWKVVLGQIDAATDKDDEGFKRTIPTLLELLGRHPLALGPGLAAVLKRYGACRDRSLNGTLRDFSVEKWGNPWLSINADRWGRVDDDVRQMIAAWLKLELIRKFFGLLAADGMNDKRRVKFWERYYDSIDDMYFALGSAAYAHPGADFVALRREMRGRLIALHSAQTTDNNAFIMRIGAYVVVEFGAPGNACYIFSWNKLPFDLDVPSIAGNGLGLKNSNHVEWLDHRDTSGGPWERKFEDALHRLTAARPSLRAATERAAAPSSTPRPSIRTAHPGLLPEASNVDASAAPPEFSETTLKQFCNSRRLDVVDLRTSNGLLWVRTHERDPNVSSRLLLWGFAYKNEQKGWWRK